jgi:hypothetical protein
MRPIKNNQNVFAMKRAIYNQARRPANGLFRSKEQFFSDIVRVFSLTMMVIVYCVHYYFDPTV